MGDYLALLSFGDGGWGMVLLLATGMTIGLALCAAPFGFGLGLLSALMIRSRFRFLRVVATVFSSLFRSLPELLTLFIVYYGLQIALQSALMWLGVTQTLTINAFFAGVLALALVSGAFSSEIWLGAFRVLDRGQIEAAQALSLPRLKTFTAVLFPQALRNALPSLANNWLTLLKDTSLVSTITLVEIMRQTKLAATQTRHFLFFYGLACLLYLILSALSGFVFRRLEKRYGAFDKVEAA